MFERNSIDPSPLLNVREAAVQLGISPFTLRRHCREGNIAHYRIFGRIKLSNQQIEEFKFKSKQEPDSEIQPSEVAARRKLASYLAMSYQKKY